MRERTRTRAEKGNNMEKVFKIYREGTKVTFLYKCGHKSTKDYSKGPVSKRVSESGLSFLCKYWANSGIYANCPKCSKT